MHRNYYWRTQLLEMEANPKFNISRAYLSQELFKVVPPKNKEVNWPLLNITVLPDYLAYLKSLMTEEQRILFSDYNAQTYLIEGAFTFNLDKSFDQLTQEILSYLRSNNRFWVRKMGVQEDKQTRHHAIETYHKDMQSQKVESLQQKYPQTNFTLGNRKIIPDDYAFIGNQYVKSSHKFTANLYPTVAIYLAPEPTPNIDSRLIFQLLVNLSLNYRPKQKKPYQGVVLPTEEEQEAYHLGEKVMNQFQEWLDKHEVNARSLSNQKEYYLISNTIRIVNHLIGLQDEQVQKMREDQFDEARANCANRVFLEREVVAMSHYVRDVVLPNLKEQMLIRQERKAEAEENWRGFISTPAQIEQAYNYYEQIIAHPENTNQTKYKITGSQVPWKDEEYKKFLLNFKEYFNVPTNNKKIATGMGKNIEASHVKYVKGIYMRNITSRIEAGEIGGGKKGVFDSKYNFLVRDIENFSMRWFKKQGKSKTKKVKKRRRRANFDGEEEDSDY